MVLRFEGRVLLAVTALLASGCTEPDARMCPTGIYCPAGKSCAAKQPVCISDGCGNGKLDPGELCDDGNKLDGDGCSGDCKSAETCGNWVVDRAAGEVCDDGNTIDGDACSADCRSLGDCGNGITDPGEECDGGWSGIRNVAIETDFCNSNCTVPRCGDTIVNTAAREECDGGPTSETGVAQETAECNANCKKSECGDGIVNRTAQEECDDGPLNSDSGDCLTSCYVNDCGDGHVNRSLDDSGQVKEECDRGGDNSDTGNCLRDCHENRCGDGHRNRTDDGTGRTEGCDSGPQDAIRNEYCLYGLQSCTLCSECQVVAGMAGYCGDGTRQTRIGNPEFGVDEACDLGPDNGATSCRYSHDRSTCDLCDSTCSVSRRQVFTPYCGDGIRQKDDGEACDDGPNPLECPYGQATCSYCNEECNGFESLTGSFCGDDEVDDRDDGTGTDSPREMCDSFVQFTCGTCEKPGTRNSDDEDVSCHRVTTGIAPAKGRITFSDRPVGSAAISVTLSDGHNKQTLAVPDGNAEEAANQFMVAVQTLRQANLLGIMAVASDGTVTLTNTTQGVVGNVPLVVDPANTLVHTGMSGGVGCALGQQCTIGVDCVSGYCETVSQACTTPN